VRIRLSAATKSRSSGALSVRQGEQLQPALQVVGEQRAEQVGPVGVEAAAGPVVESRVKFRSKSRGLQWVSPSRRKPTSDARTIGEYAARRGVDPGIGSFQGAGHGGALLNERANRGKFARHVESDRSNDEVLFREKGDEPSGS